MEGLRNTPGFWGPSLLADITLIVEVLFYLSLCAGVVAQLQRKYKWHDRFQIPVVVLNIFFILFVMVPTFTSVAGTLPSGISQPPTLVTVLHGILGTIAQGLGIYCLLAGLKILPRKIGVLRYWMWAAFTFWTLTIVLGIGIYILYYTGGDTSGDLAAEHDAEAVAEQPAAPAEGEAVEEHAEEAIPAEQPAAPAEGEVVEEHAEEAVPAEATPAEGEVVEEHAEEAVPAEATPAEGETAEGTETEPEEHAEEGVTEAPVVTGQALQGTWQLLQPINEAPNARQEHAVAYDPATNQMYLFGGRNGDQIKDDTWVLDVNTLSWGFLAAHSPAAPVLYSTVMIVDDGSLYLGTGQSPVGVTNEVWRLDLASQTWQNLGTGAGDAPEPRYGGPGGDLGGNLVVTHGFGSQRYDDTWRFNPSASQWENMTPSGALPAGRCLFAATPSGGNLVLHGGCASPDGPCFLDDTWILDTGANVWREILSDVKPAGRQHHTLVAGPESNQIVLFGGQDASQAPLGDIWILDLATGVWQPIEAADGPGPRYNHSAVWIPGRGMLIFGGRNNEGALNDMWLLSLQAPATEAPAAEPTATTAPAEAAPAEPTEAPAEPTPTPELVSEHDGN